MTSELQQTRYDRLIRRVGGIIGPGSKVSEALSELFPVIDVERVPGELLLLGGTILGHGASQITGNAGEVGRLQLFNPLGSGKLVTVSTAVVSVPQTSIIRSTISNIALPTGVGTELSRDARLLIGSRTAAQIRSLSSVALTGATELYRVLANSPLFLTDPNGLAVLPPGFGHEFSSNIVATAINVTWFWRERPAEQSELNF